MWFKAFVSRNARANKKVEYTRGNRLKSMIFIYFYLGSDIRIFSIGSCYNIHLKKAPNS